MVDPSLPQVITAIATVITAAGGLVLALATWRTAERTKAVQATAKATENKVDEVHVIVNQRFTDLQRYTEALVRALDRAGVEVPVDQSIPAVPAESVAAQATTPPGAPVTLLKITGETGNRWTDGSTP